MAFYCITRTHAKNTYQTRYFWLWWKRKFLILLQVFYYWVTKKIFDGKKNHHLPPQTWQTVKKWRNFLAFMFWLNKKFQDICRYFGYFLLVNFTIKVIMLRWCVFSSFFAFLLPFFPKLRWLINLISITLS